MLDRHQRFSIYDLMERRGAFRRNPANPDSVDDNNQRIYSGPVEYPKMLYHPEGLEEIVEAGSLESTPLGIKHVGERRELISQRVDSPAQEAALLAKGWHEHPADAIEARTGVRPAVSPQNTIDAKDREIERLRRQLAEAQGKEPGGEPDPGPLRPIQTNRRAAEIAPDA